MHERFQAIEENENINTYRSVSSPDVTAMAELLRLCWKSLTIR